MHSWMKANWICSTPQHRCLCHGAHRELRYLAADDKTRRLVKSSLWLLPGFTYTYIYIGTNLRTFSQTANYNACIACKNISGLLSWCQILYETRSLGSWGNLLGLQQKENRSRKGPCGWGSFVFKSLFQHDITQQNTLVHSNWWVLLADFLH